MPDLALAVAGLLPGGLQMDATLCLPGTASGGMEHMAIWTRAYSIESIVEWIFTTTK